MFDAIAAVRTGLCDRLAGFTDGQWSTPSLCDGWTAHQVLAHLVTVQEVPTWRFVVGVVGMNGFHRRADGIARDHAARRSSEELVSAYRRHAVSRRVPRLIGPIAPLTDVVVHDLDIGRPLGLAPVAAADDVHRTVLDALCRGLPGFASKRVVRGLRFESTDLDWAHGDGPVVRGGWADLALAVTGRTPHDLQIDGPGVAELKRRLDG